MTKVKTALVVGGGIAGPVAAMALRQAGIEARVYEAYGSTAENVGGGLSIAPNGLAALKVIGADEAVRAIGVPMSSIVMHSWTGKRLASFGGPAGLEPQQFVMRPDLYRALYGEAARRGIAVEHGKRLVSAEHLGSPAAPAGVRAHFADGTTAEADVLIGADGIRSTVRTLIDPGAPKPRYTGLLGFGCLSTGTGLPSTGDAMHMMFGKRAFFGYQVYADGSCGWFANLPHPEPMSWSEANRTSPQEWLRVLTAAFADDRLPVLDILRTADLSQFVAVGGMEDIPRVPNWHRGRMVLIGDAAHATSPSSGQGASLAAESAVQLARCLRDLPAEQAFGAYERLRRERVERIIAAAARTNSNKAAGPVARVLRDALLPTAMKLLAKPEKMAWQFIHPIDWQAPVTV
ncbi:FAD-dependent oxidoreductase [Catellatospora coxensis]|uniref:FAD-dependent oxidoreductase n=1 Tax=Catellatospora coxensis TaxID=310354 RepID=A0A8J3KS71_9ACTN|nr:FAD-dependent monooxygenase [Catellatospora coxensis]GIG04064.1 FAD-dependent oxidoreductase [Catellatospora coxensis]